MNDAATRFDANHLLDDRAVARALLDRAAEITRGFGATALRWTRVLADLTLAHTVFVEAFGGVPDNTRMRNVIEDNGMTVYRRYRILERAL